MPRLYMNIVIVACSLVASAQSCYTYNLRQNFPYLGWAGTHRHNSGSHFQTYFMQLQCNYTNTSGNYNGAPCDTTERAYWAFFLMGGYGTGDNGTVQGTLAYHTLDPASTSYFAARTKSGTPSGMVDGGVAVNECRSGSCQPFTITVVPFSATGNGIIETSGQFVGNIGGCPTRYYKLTGQGCPPSCGSPLMMDASGRGPFKHLKEMDDFFQLADADGPDAIDFKLVQQNDSWERTPSQRIAWPKPESSMVVLVLPDDNGKVNTSDELFGDHTHCGVELCGNGFKALLYKCDAPAHGGNGDGLCNKDDALYYQLRWLSGKPNDLKSKLYRLDELGEFTSFDLREGAFHELTGEYRLVDNYGNQARFQGMVSFGWKPSGEGMRTDRRTVWDVWLRMKQ